MLRRGAPRRCRAPLARAGKNLTVMTDNERGFIDPFAEPWWHERSASTDSRALGAPAFIDPLGVPKRLVMAPVVPDLPPIETIFAMVARMAGEVWQ